MGGGKTRVLHTDLSGLVSVKGMHGEHERCPVASRYAVVPSWFAGMTSDCVQHDVQSRAEVHE